MTVARRWRGFVPAVSGRTGVTVGLFAVLLVTAGCGDPADSNPGELRDAVRIEGAPMCPWRNPGADLAAWFPGATRSDAEVRILSGLRPELTRRLGRTPTAEENALYVHQVFRDSQLMGEVAVRRVKGESGAVEVAVAFEPDGRILGVHLQRSREPDAVSIALNDTWLSGFRGRSAADPLVPGRDLPAVPGSARITANAVADGVRSLLILRELAGGPRAVRRPAPEASAGHLH